MLDDADCVGRRGGVMFLATILKVFPPESPGMTSSNFSQAQKL